MAGNYIGTELYIKNKNSFRNSERERGDLFIRSRRRNQGDKQYESNRIGKNINGIKIGFGSTKAWNLKQRKEVVRKKDKDKAELNESLSNQIGF